MPSPIDSEGSPSRQSHVAFADEVFDTFETVEDWGALRRLVYAAADEREAQRRQAQDAEERLAAERQAAERAAAEHKAELEAAAQEVLATSLPLLEAWPPRPLPSEPGCYSLRLRRASTRQSFGIPFDATVCFGEDKHVRIALSQDLPHLGVQRGDTVVSVNGYEPHSVSMFRCIMAEAMAIRLVMRHRHGATATAPLPSALSWPEALPVRRERLVLLATSRAVAVDMRHSEFRLVMWRHSPSQSFGLGLTEAARLPDEVVLLTSQEQPHLALRKADHLIEINGVQDPTKDALLPLLEEETELRLRFRRETRGAGAGFHLVQILQDLEGLDDPASEDEAAEAQVAPGVDEPKVSAYSCLACDCDGPDTVGRGYAAVHRTEDPPVLHRSPLRMATPKPPPPLARRMMQYTAWEEEMPKAPSHAKAPSREAWDGDSDLPTESEVVAHVSPGSKPRSPAEGLCLNACGCSSEDEAPEVYTLAVRDFGSSADRPERKDSPLLHCWAGEDCTV